MHACPLFNCIDSILFQLFYLYLYPCPVIQLCSVFFMFNSIYLQFSIVNCASIHQFSQRQNLMYSAVPCSNVYMYVLTYSQFNCKILCSVVDYLTVYTYCLTIFVFNCSLFNCIHTQLSLFSCCIVSLFSCFMLTVCVQ